MNVRDFMGREIKLGDTIVYPVRRASSMWLSSSVVEGIIEGEDKYGDKVTSLVVKHPDTCGRSTIQRIDRVVVVEPVE